MGKLINSMTIFHSHLFFLLGALLILEVVTIYELHFKYFKLNELKF